MPNLLKKITTLNNKIAVRCTLMISTMWCVYTFIILTIIPLFFPSTNRIIQYISSAFLQLIFLPLIMVGQSIIGEKEEKRNLQDHKMIMEELKEIKGIKRELEEIKKMLED